MPYKSTSCIQVKEPTKQALEQYKEEGESWNTFFNRIIALIEQEISKDNAGIQPENLV